VHPGQAGTPPAGRHVDLTDIRPVLLVDFVARDVGDKLVTNQASAFW